jgi:eukaryotic-like serine/threonine-protein kinase
MTLEQGSSSMSFIGRRRELAELDSGLSDAISGRGRLFLLSGEPGIGKSRLADEFSTMAARRGVAVIWGRCWEGSGAPAYWPLIQIIRGCAARPHFARHIERLGTNASFIASIVPEIRQGFELPLQETGSTTPDPEEARFKLFDSVTTLFRTISLDDPLMLVIDDLHDADQSSLKMLRFMAGGLRESRIFVLGTYRDAEVTSSPDLQRSVGDLSREALTIPLGGLAKRELAELVESRTGRPADEGFVETLYQATDGNPLFADGVVRMLIAQGEFEQGKPIGADRFKIPAGVRESIHRTLASLPPAALPILEVSAAIGNEFDVGLLQSASGTEAANLRLLLEQASRVGVLLPTAEPRNWRFAHALIREAIYQEIASNERRRVHAQIAASIENRYGSDLKPHLAALAHHFHEAEIPEKAIDYLDRAGDAAAAVYAFDGAISQWGKAVELFGERGGDINRNADLLAKLGFILYQSDTNKGIGHIEEALTLYERAGDDQSAIRWHAQLGVSLGSAGAQKDVRRALAHLRRAESLLSKGPETGTLAYVYCGFGMAARCELRVREAIEYMRRGFEVAERTGDADNGCTCSGMLSLCLTEAGKLTEAQAMAVKSRERIPALTDPLTTYGAFSIAGGFYMCLWDYRSARLLYQRALENRALAKWQRLMISAQAGRAAVLMGDIATARRRVAEGKRSVWMAHFSTETSKASAIRWNGRSKACTSLIPRMRFFFSVISLWSSEPLANIRELAPSWKISCESSLTASHTS